eukprot:Sspe_Gene.100784::Locus_75441_Transcript_1_1_Confidence_1.000_Length_1766::g.100784::m.100784/K11273/DDX11, CHL1, CTF1; chromosome transmission fidelity protein 1
MLCINAAARARAKGSAERLNDICNDLGCAPQRKKRRETKEKEEKKETGCSFCPYTEPSAMQGLVDVMRARQMDIEDLVAEGKRRKACPYYSTRRAISFSNLIAVPYTSLLADSSRQITGIQLDGNVVIMDEAHNVVDAVNRSHSVEVSHDVIADTATVVGSYLEKYKNRLHVRNKARLRQLHRVLKNLAGYLEKRRGAGSLQQVLSRTELTFGAEIEGVNFPDLEAFVRKRQLLPKLHSFLDRQHEGSVKGEGHTVGQMYGVFRFLTALIADDRDSKLLLTVDKGAAVLRVLSVYAGHVFEPIVNRPRSLVLCGGTMSPIEDVRHELLSEMREGRHLHVYQCGHVVGGHQVLAGCLAKGPRGVPFDFRHKTRSDPTLLADAGQTVINMARIAPGGMILFFTSYSYMDEVYASWEGSGKLAQLRKVKEVFREPRGGGGDDLATMLRKYQAACDAARHSSPGDLNGAVLFSVIGGKLSEGINFSDHYGRCVIVIGMPYPNPHDIEIKEKQLAISERVGASEAASMLDIICMKAVNQSIGRAIRHKEDYAAILLLDERYQQVRIQQLIAG